MSDHRVRLTDRELLLITSALRARMTGVGGERGAELYRLAVRLEEMQPGNPEWRLGDALVRP